jgi:SWI/SNF-related matrix-associated actin-dependent regulator 1 of chromatin subfamily A
MPVDEYMTNITKTSAKGRNATSGGAGSGALALPLLPASILSALRASPVSVESAQSLVRASVWDRLLNHQREAVSSILYRKPKGRALVADEMGLGKTITAIAAMDALTRDRKLVICPAFLQHNWTVELQEWSIGFDEWTVCSYHAAMKLVGNAREWAGVVVDESHYLKSPQSQRTIRLTPMLQTVEYCFMLSGTPAPSRPIELWTALFILRPKYAGTWTEYARRYCGLQRTPWGPKAQGAVRTEELSWLLRKIYMIRRTKEVIRNLPMKIRHRVAIKPSDIYVPELEKLQKGLNRAIADNDEPKVNLYMSRLFRLTCIAKTEGVIKVLERELERHPQGTIVVFAHHRAMLDAIQQWATVSWVRIDGSMTMKTRTDATARMAQVRLALCTYGATGVGLSFTCARVAIMAELFYVPSVLAQAEDRLHRIRQLHNVHITYVVCAEPSLDIRVWRSLRKKQEQLHCTVDRV